jgi:hypothetical protein
MPDMRDGGLPPSAVAIDKFVLRRQQRRENVDLLAEDTASLRDEIENFYKIAYIYQNQFESVK